MRLFRRVLLVPLLLAALLLSASAVAPAAAQSVIDGLDFAAYFRGLHVADMHAQLAITPQTYRVQLSFHLAGTVGALFHAEGVSTVDGRFQGDTAEPRALLSTGQMRGTARVTQIDWQDRRPTVVKLEPPVEPEREKVTAEQQANTIDSLSAMAVLLHRLAATGRCESEARVFDGRFLSHIEARTIGQEALEETSRSSFHGTALRCAIEGHQLAGFVRDADEAALHRPHRASVWFARIVPGGPLVPVRIELDTHGYGTAVMYLAPAAP